MITNAEYHADPAISASHLHAVAKSPQAYWSRYINPDRPVVEPTAAMRLGSLVHCAVLEPEELSKRYSRCAPRNTKAGKEQAADLAARGIEAVTDADWSMAIAMNNAVRTHPIAAELLATGKAEQSFWWNDSLTTLRCKCRPDWLSNTTVVDLKTTTDASPSGFARSVAAYRYHVQAAHYMSGLFGVERFIFIAVEKTYPFAVGVYELDDAAMDEGHTLRHRDLHRIHTCRSSARWPGFTDDSITTLSLPRWAFNDGSITPEDF